MSWYPDQNGAGREGFERWRPREGHVDGGRYGNRGGQNKEWYAAKFRAQRAGPEVLKQWLKDNPKPKSQPKAK